MLAPYQQHSPVVYLTASFTGSFVTGAEYYLEGLNERPEQSSNAFTFTQHLNEPHGSEQTEKVDADAIATRLRRER